MNIGQGNKRKTVLLVDSDAHARAALRSALEAAGFSVGEAANAKEGERTAIRIQPHAILADVVMEHIDADGALAEKLRDAGSRIPIYIISHAADALVGSVGFKELGVSGIFLKPTDPAIVIQTLKTRLGVHSS